ncbi:MAG: toll/interleukin-1 receptor domain-containing protein [Coriobacteriales bacterium]|nr:toll/interleukin-1 receptor domain-containing protein [Coriobacteriales bacterium]
MPECEEYDYEAFISYRHLPLSINVAKQLQHDIEGYRVPREFRATVGKARLGKLFRDKDELPASASLSKQIREALEHSHYLIVVCTPETKESNWVEREIKAFASLHGRDRILAVLAEGELKDCMPKLLGHYKKRRENGSAVLVATEPLAADFRDSSRNSRRDETLRVVSALLGCGLDDLKNRRHAKRKKLTRHLAIATAIVSVAVAILIFIDQQNALRLQRNLQVRQSNIHAAQSDILLACGDRVQAIQAALAALPQSSQDVDRPFKPEAQAALERSLRVYQTSDQWMLSYFNAESSGVVDFACNEQNGAYAVVDKWMVFHSYSIDTGKQLQQLDLKEVIPTGYSFNSTSTRIWYPELNRVILYDRYCNNVLCIDTLEGTNIWGISPHAKGPDVRGFNISDESNVGCMLSREETFDQDNNPVSCMKITIIDTLSGDTLNDVSIVPELTDAIQFEDCSCVTNNDGSFAAVQAGANVYMANLNTKEVQLVHVPYPDCKMHWIDSKLIVSSWDSSASTPYPCTTQLFSPAGDELWKYETVIPLSFTNNVTYHGEPNIWGMLSAEGELGERILTSYGERLAILDLETGAQVEVTDANAPIIECRVVENAENDEVHICSVNGSIKLLELNEAGLSACSSMDSEISRVLKAKFCLTEQALHLVTQPVLGDVGNVRTVVYKAYNTDDDRSMTFDFNNWSLPKEQSDEDVQLLLSQHDDLLGTLSCEKSDVGFLLFSPDGKKAVVQVHGRIYRVDLLKDAVEAATTREFENLVAGGFAENGTLFYAQCPILGDPYDRCELLVFDMAGESFMPKSEIRFGVMLSDDGKQVLIDDKSDRSDHAWSLPYLSLDELIERGRSLSSEYELTNEDENERGKSLVNNLPLTTTINSKL